MTRRGVIRLAGLLTMTVVLAGEGVSATQASGVAGETEYIVQLVQPSAVDHDARGGDQRFDPNSPTVRRYSESLVTAANAVAAHVGASVHDVYSLSFAGFSAPLDADQVRALEANDEVRSVEPASSSTMQSTPIHSRPVSTGLGDSEGLGGLWEEVGGPTHAGEGVVIGVIDGGISVDDTHFGGQALTAIRKYNPHVAAHSIRILPGDRVIAERIVRFHKPDGRDFLGRCPSGNSQGAQLCSTKIVAAQAFPPPTSMRPLADGEFDSPKAATGHGPNVASIAAANRPAGRERRGQGYRPVGVAPAARLAIYKACWMLRGGPEPVCPTASVVSAIEAAVQQGVDVLNLSIVERGPVNGIDSATSAALRGAAQAGIFVSAAAGNAGPGASTITDNVAPWITTVANSTSPDLRNTLVVTGERNFIPVTYSYEGVSIDPRASGWYPIVLAAWVSTVNKAKNCQPGSLLPTATQGKIVVCPIKLSHGLVGSRNVRLSARAEVKRAGGVATILVPVSVVEPPIDAAGSIPDLVLHDPSIVKYLGTMMRATVSGRLTGRPLETPDNPPPAPMIATDSARGPVPDRDGDILKPDVAALGTADDGAGHERQSPADPMTLSAGTSQAAAIVSGLAAIYFAKHPGALPGDIKSALMTTARSVRTGEDTPETDVFAQGAGLVTGTEYLSPGLLYRNNDDDWRAFSRYLTGEDAGAVGLARSPTDLNLASIQIGNLSGSLTVKRLVTSTEKGTWRATMSGLNGLATLVEPDTLSFPGAGITKEFTVTVRRTGAAFDVFATGYLTWTNSDTGRVARSPIAVRPIRGLERAAPEISVSGASGSEAIALNSSSNGVTGPIGSALAEGHLLDAPVPVIRFAPNMPNPLIYNYPTFSVDTGGFARFVVADTAPVPDADSELTVQLIRLENDIRHVIARAKPDGISKTLDVFGLPAGNYAFQIISDDSHPVTWAVTQFVAVNSFSGPRITITPTFVGLTAGVAGEVKAGWSGLTPGANYLGYIYFGSRDWRTLVSITVPPVTVSGVQQNDTGKPSGSTAGGTLVTISGTGLDVATGVNFGGVAAAIVISNDNELIVETPPHEAGPVDVVVVSDGQTTTAASAFTYGDPPIIAGIFPSSTQAEIGGPFLIVGSGFTDDLMLKIGDQVIADRQVGRSENGDQIDADAPAAPRGSAEITVTTEFGRATADLDYENFPGEG